MNRLEALVDAFAATNQFQHPESVAYQTRNPLLLKCFSIQHPMNDQGYRIFGSLVSGYQAALFDVQHKCSGLSRAKVNSESSLAELARVYGHYEVEAIAQFISKALAETVSQDTQLKFFMGQ